MKKALNIRALLASIIAVATASACTNTGATKTEKTDGLEWNVSVNRVVPLNDPALGINTDSTYTVADTARVNEQLTGLAQRENVSLGWTMPSADGDIWLVAYENEPVLSENVSIAATNPISAYDGNIQVAFKFSDTAKWAAITQDNTGKRLAIFVNGKLINAPQINTTITSGNCSVTFPASQAHKYLPPTP